MTNTRKIREQLEEFALNMKPGTTKGKHRTAIFDTLELASLVKSLIDGAVREARVDEMKRLISKEWQRGDTYAHVKDRLIELLDKGQS